MQQDEGYRPALVKFHCVIGRRRITIQPSPSGLVQFNMWQPIDYRPRRFFRLPDFPRILPN